MSETQTTIPSTEGIIDLSTLDTTVEINEESSIQQDLKDALAGKTVTTDPLGLEEQEVLEPVVTLQEKEEIANPISEESQGSTKSNSEMLTSLKLILGEDFTTIVRQNDDGEEVEVSLEDIELTPDVVAEIITAKHQMDLEASKKDFISTKGVSELGKSLIEIDKRGGDITELLRVKQSIFDPLENLDLGTLAGQKQALLIRLQASNTPQEDIELLISAYETKGILEEKANTAANEIKDYFKRLVEEEKQQTLDAEEARNKLLKDYTKDLKTSLSNSFELKPEVQDKIVKSSTKRDDNGNYEIDAIYNQWRNDPSKTALLSLFLLDNEEYNNQVSKKKRITDKLENASKLGVIKLGRKSTDKDNNKNTNKSGIIDLSAL